MQERDNIKHLANNVIMMYMGGTAHTLSNYLLACGIGAWLGTFGVAAPMSCISLAVYYCMRRQVRHPPYGPWDHVPSHVWTDESNAAATEDEGEDEVEVCALFCLKRSTIPVCDECKEHYCCECIDTHTCGNNIIC